MVKVHSVFKVLALGLFLGSFGASSGLAEAPATFYGHYDFTWNELALGSLVLGIEETNSTYKLRLHVASEGLVNVFTHHTDDTVASGTRSGTTYQVGNYETHYKTKGKPRHIKLAWDEKKVMTEELVEPPENRDQRPEVPHELKDGAFDPLSGLLVTRAGQDWRGFDGKHLYQINVKKAAATTLSAGTDAVAVIPYTMSRTALAGMTQKELNDLKNKKEPALTLYISDDDKRVPLMVTVPAFLGTVRGTLTKQCASFEECLN